MMQLFFLKKSFGPIFDIVNFIWNLFGWGLSPILKYFSFGYTIKFQIKKPLGLVLKLVLVPWTHFTFLCGRNCTSTKLYNKLKHRCMYVQN
jgi:hypothetical protein